MLMRFLRWIQFLKRSSIRNYEKYHFKACFQFFKIHFEKFLSDLFIRSYWMFHLKNTFFFKLQYPVKYEVFEKISKYKKCLFSYGKSKNIYFYRIKLVTENNDIRCLYNWNYVSKIQFYLYSNYKKNMKTKFFRSYHFI